MFPRTASLFHQDVRGMNPEIFERPSHLCVLLLFFVPSSLRSRSRRVQAVRIGGKAKVVGKGGDALLHGRRQWHSEVFRG